jgi:hypothetical protein
MHELLQNCTSDGVDPDIRYSLGIFASIPEAFRTKKLSQRFERLLLPRVLWLAWEVQKWKKVF